jgi:aspartate-semialdehyde dehydrogenase
MAKLRAGVIGATGNVGQMYLKLLENHPFFDVTWIAASPQSAGKPYREAVGARWFMNTEIPGQVRDLVVADANDYQSVVGRCDFVFSALDLDKKLILELEDNYARVGLPVVSNNSAHRKTPDVPMLIPEINHAHTAIIPEQQKARGWKRGFIVVKPNCSLQSYITPVFALQAAGFPVSTMVITTMQAVSGAGYNGVPSMDMVDNLVPFIGGEEEKTEEEPHKILGRIEGERIVSDTSLKISAHCNRVPVVDGHTACVSMGFAGKKPSRDEILRIWKSFSSLPQQMKLPLAPAQPILYRDEDNRPQPRKDRDADKGMAVVVGRLRECRVFDFRFVGLSHNTVRGAAGGGILNAELLHRQGYLTRA